MAPSDLASCGLPEAWSQQTAWTVLDTDFQDGQHFLRIWQAWQRDPQRPRVLHYVGITPVVPLFEAIPLLAWHSEGLGPGFHRILLEEAKVSLTLCVGDVTTMLTEQVFQGDTLFVREPADRWEVQALARRCKRGSRFKMPSEPAPGTQALLQAAGFRLNAPTSKAAGLEGCFDPQWDIPTSRTRSPHTVSAPTHCAVIGAGISGASIAHALALRGWQVTVFDRAAHPAAGASGLPVGLAVPHASADDSPRSRLSRSGIRLLTAHADRMLVRGQDWDPSGVTEHKPDGSTVWHAQACWIKPAQLVQAWLSAPGIRFVGQSAVTTLRRQPGLWVLGGADGQVFGGFETVVVANALGCATLLNSLHADDALGENFRHTLAALQPVHGTLSHGWYAEAPPSALPATPINGNGSFIPQVPDARGVGWYAGSTFEDDADRVADVPEQHRLNMQRLRQLLPVVGDMDPVEWLGQGPVTQWSGTRCTTHDRLPLVGPLDTASGPGLWLCAGMGSRGLSFSALCAELLVARLGAEPLPVEFSLSRSLDVNRPRRQKTTTRQNSEQ